MSASKALTEALAAQPLLRVLSGRVRIPLTEGANMTKPHLPTVGITYHPTYRPGKDQHTKGELKRVSVHLDGRLVGHICHPPLSNGWCYLPKGKKHVDGEDAVFPSVAAVKLSLEASVVPAADVTPWAREDSGPEGLLDHATLAAITGDE